MEARVDIKKLQLLNDRIVQTIEALNQVRLTVHGLQHSASVPSGIPTGIPAGIPFAQQGMAFGPQTMPAMYGQQPYSAFGATPFGLSHTSVNPSAALFGAAQLTPTGYPLPFVPNVGNFGMNVAAWPSVGSTGLSHSTIEEQWIAELRAQDPRRLTQTFPYCYNP
jgi:hypothetical protein